MRKYYTRPCNFYYGNLAKKLINDKKALSLAGNKNIAFDQIETFERKKKGIIKSVFFKLNEVKFISKEKKQVIIKDIKLISSKRKPILRLKFHNPEIMGVLNLTPDSFSDGGLFFDSSKAFEQAKNMIKGGAKIIDIGGESTRPGSKIINSIDEWKRVKNIIYKLRKKFPSLLLSLDTRKSLVMKKGIDFRINLINDVSGLNFDK
jgi:dihydropteroate synthase